MAEILSIVIPVRFDDRVHHASRMLHDYLTLRGTKHEILVAGVLRDPGTLPSFVRFVEANGLKGVNVRAGIRVASGNRTLLIDADLPTDLEAIGHLIEHETTASVVFGKRVFVAWGCGDLWRFLRSGLFRGFVSFLFPQLRIIDTQFGLKLITSSFAESLLKKPSILNGLTYDVEMALNAVDGGFTTNSIQVPFVERGGSVVCAPAVATSMIMQLLFLKLNWHPCLTMCCNQNLPAGQNLTYASTSPLSNVVQLRR